MGCIALRLHVVDFDNAVRVTMGRAQGLRDAIDVFLVIITGFRARGDGCAGENALQGGDRQNRRKIEKYVLVKAFV